MASLNRPVPELRGDRAAAISNAIVRLHREYYGKGPTRAKTHFVDDLVLVVLEGGVTRVERTLFERGRASLIHDVRRTFQETMHDAFVSVVEEITGRKVRAFVSQFHIDPDLAVEVFFFDDGTPADAPDPPEDAATTDGDAGDPGNPDDPGVERRERTVRDR
jgi:uncharacterized protein YbcI